MRKLIACIILCASAGAADRPQSPYIDRGVCPFECCTYREWKVVKTTKVYASPDGKRVVATLQKGTWVQGITGETHSTPVAMRIPFDDPELNLRKGELVYVLHYQGEGYWRVWVRGRIVDEQLDLNGPEPKTDWWAQIKMKDGTIGWVLMADQFDNVDACA